MANPDTTTVQSPALPEALGLLLDDPSVKQILGLPEDLSQRLRAWGIFIQPKEPGYFMVRLCLDAGDISQEQWSGLSKIVAEHGRELLDITSRGGLVLRWIHATKLREVIEGLNELGLVRPGAGGAHLRSIIGCPLTGIDKDELIETHPVIRALRDAFNPEAVTLPGSLKIGVFGHEQACCFSQTQDLAFSVGYPATSKEPQAGFRVWVAGVDLGIWIASEEVATVARALVSQWIDFAAGQPDETQKFGDMAEAVGAEGMQNRVAQALGHALVPVQLLPEDKVFAQSDHIGVYAQKQPGLYAVGVPVLVGRLNSAQIKKISDMCKRYGEEIALRTTPKQNLVLLNVREEHVQKFLLGLRDVDLSINANPIRRGWLSCTGSEFCRLAYTETRARARHFVEHLESRVRLTHPLRIHMEGCSAGCVRGELADIHLTGQRMERDGQSMESYRVAVRGIEVADALSVSECLKRLEFLLQRYKRKSRDGETFTQWADRSGEKKLRKILEEDFSHPLEQE